MCVVSDDEGPALGPSNRISTSDWGEEQHTTLGMYGASLKRMSLGPNCDALTCVDAKNMQKELSTKRNVKRQKCTMRERGPGQTYKWVVPCYNMNEVSKPRLGYKKIRCSPYGQLENYASTKTRISKRLV